MILVKPKRPFWDWVKSVEPDKYDPIVETMPERGTVFLIPELDDGDEALQQYLKDNYMDFFEHILWAWYTDESVFPKKRDFKMFNDWFEVEYHSIILDTEPDEIEREEFC